MYLRTRSRFVIDENIEKSERPAASLHLRSWKSRATAGFVSIRKVNWLIGGCADVANHSSGELREVTLLNWYARGDVVRFFDHDDLRQTEIRSSR
jgi:hypothetical protein